MQGFIEVTAKDTGRKALVNISDLEAVFDEGKTASLCLKAHTTLRKITHYTIEVEETYWEVKERIVEAQRISLDEIEDLEE